MLQPTTLYTTKKKFTEANQCLWNLGSKKSYFLQETLPWQLIKSIFLRWSSHCWQQQLQKQRQFCIVLISSDRLDWVTKMYRLYRLVTNFSHRVWKYAVNVQLHHSKWPLSRYSWTAYNHDNTTRWTRLQVDWATTKCHPKITNFALELLSTKWTILALCAMSTNKRNFLDHPTKCTI